MTYPRLIADSQSAPEPIVNANFGALAWAAVYAQDTLLSAGLAWAYFGGRWGGFAVAEGTLALAASSTNFIVVERATGVISASTDSAQYVAATVYARVYKVMTAVGSVTSVLDDRAGPGGVHGSITASAPAPAPAPAPSPTPAPAPSPTPAPAPSPVTAPTSASITTGSGSGGGATVAIGYQIDLTASYAGTTDPVTFKWSKDGPLIDGATSEEYLRTAQSTGDGGTYSVLVSNSAGSVSASIQITVPASAPAPSPAPTPASSGGASRVALDQVFWPPGRASALAGDDEAIRRSYLFTQENF